jgi:hypothetical protein
MTDYEYIITQCRKYNNSLWENTILKECIDKLKTLSVKELCDLLFEKEVHKRKDRSAYSDGGLEDIIENGKRQDELKSAIVEAIPTTSLVKILYSSPNDYIGKNGRERSIEFLNIFSQSYKLAKEELGRRYLADVDSKIIEKAFNHTNESNKEWLKWQKKKWKIAEKRYQDPFLKKLEDYEKFADEEFVVHGIHGYDNVISIKGCRSFWDEDGKRISSIDFILNACGVAPQYIGLGDEVVFAVASNNFELESAFEYKPEYMNSLLRNKIDKIFEREYDKNIVLGCMLVEKFIRIIDPKINAKVRCYDKDYLLGHFVMECPDKLFTTIDTIASIRDLAPKGKKMDAFIDLLDNLLNPSWKLPF